MEQLIDWFGFELLKLFRARLGGVCWEGPEAWSLKASHDSNIMSQPTLGLEAKSSHFGAWQCWVALGKSPKSSLASSEVLGGGKKGRLWTSHFRSWLQCLTWEIGPT